MKHRERGLQVHCGSVEGGVAGDGVTPWSGPGSVLTPGEVMGVEVVALQQEVVQVDDEVEDKLLQEAQSSPGGPRWQ